MASGPTSSGGSHSRRGLISCLHSLKCRDEDAPLPHDDDLRQATHQLIVGLYDEAFRRLRLSCKAMPDLYGLLSTRGLCLGLLDPVSNIILNTIVLLDPKTKPPKDDYYYDVDAAPPAAKRRCRPGFDPWHEVACRSTHSLMAFLVAYFGCINEPQAFRYLYRANANLNLAVMLVQHDLFHAEPEALDPESDRTRAALKWAATSAGDDSSATLARVMAIRLKHADLDLVKKKLFSATPLH
uniref:PIR2-like helical domain-containing protein n=1 Tax=Aegilops tauschii TaxID=37682 RepID=M8C2J5_AEGTA